MDGKALLGGAAGAAVLALLLKQFAMRKRGGKPAMTRLPDSKLSGLFSQTRAAHTAAPVAAVRAKPKAAG